MIHPSRAHGFGRGLCWGRLAIFFCLTSCRTYQGLQPRQIRQVYRPGSRARSRTLRGDPGEPGESGEPENLPTCAPGGGGERRATTSPRPRSGRGCGARGRGMTAPHGRAQRCASGEGISFLGCVGVRLRRSCPWQSTAARATCRSEADGTFRSWPKHQSEGISGWNPSAIRFGCTPAT